jgi:hypothetical protein
MEWNVGRGLTTVTIASHRDGKASSFQPRGGTGFENAAIRQVGDQFRRAAVALESHFRPVTEWPLPPPRSMIFYILMRHETLSSPILAERDITRAEHPFYEIGALAQQLITKVRRAPTGY